MLRGAVVQGGAAAKCLTPRWEKEFSPLSKTRMSKGISRDDPVGPRRPQALLPLRQAPAGRAVRPQAAAVERLRQLVPPLPGREPTRVAGQAAGRRLIAGVYQARSPSRASGRAAPRTHAARQALRRADAMARPPSRRTYFAGVTGAQLRAALGARSAPVPAVPSGRRSCAPIRTRHVVAARSALGLPGPSTPCGPPDAAVAARIGRTGPMTRASPAQECPDVPATRCAVARSPSSFRRPMTPRRPFVPG